MKTIVVMLQFVCLAVMADTLPVGSVIPAIGTPASCPTGFTCSMISVVTPNYPCSASAAIAILEPLPPIVPVVTDLFFSGSGGGAWWTTTLYSGNTFISDLTNAGHRIVQISWNGNGWMQKGACPDPIYPIAASCRGATVIKYVHDRWSNTPLNVLGSSAGSWLLSDSLAFYGAEQWITGVADLVSTNPGMEIYKGCQSVYVGYSYDSAADAIFNSFFFNSLCGSGQVDPNWATNSVEYGGNYSYACRGHVFVGALDDSFITNRGNDYFNLVSPGSPNFVFTSVPHTGHQFQISQTGVAAITSSLLNDWKTVTPTPTVPPTPTPTPTCTCP